MRPLRLHQNDKPLILGQTHIYRLGILDLLLGPTPFIMLFELFHMYYYTINLFSRQQKNTKNHEKYNSKKDNILITF